MFKIHNRNHKTSHGEHGAPSRENTIRFAILLISLLFLGIVSGFATTRSGALLSNIAGSAVLLAGLASMYHNRLLLAAGILLLIPAMATRWTFFWLNASTLAFYSNLFYLLFVAFNAGALFLYIQRRGTPTTDTIYGGVCVYLLLGSCFAQAFMLLEIIAPGSFYFAHGVPVGNDALANQMSYYSFVTLSTAGFGDITPLSAPAMSLTTIETVIGPMYIAVFLARLVGVRTSNH